MHAMELRGRSVAVIYMQGQYLGGEGEEEQEAKTMHREMGGAVTARRS